MASQQRDPTQARITAALPLTRIARDEGEDARRRRLYLPGARPHPPLAKTRFLVDAAPEV